MVRKNKIGMVVVRFMDLKAGLYGHETGQRRQDEQDRLKCPQDGSFETVPTIFHFLVKKRTKNTKGKGKKKTRCSRAEPR